ncbi:TRAP transporter small permease [Alcaligenaceae bacterium CGII-47]|nr:TRAP transporter small permease [Alcaligenaceae bacterium CGII-47]
MFDHAGRTLMRLLEILLVVCLAVMGVLVFGNVVMRYVFNSSIAVSEELSRLLFVWLIFLGAILASAQRTHIGYDSLVQRASPRIRKALGLFTGALMLIACVIFIKGGWSQTLINLNNEYPVIGVSYAWLYGVALVFGVALIFPVCNNIWRILSNRDEALTEDLADRIEGKVSEMHPDKQEPRP